jgi:L-malate glycosyltransferase
MKLCLIANARLVHTWRWITPLVERGHVVRLMSYTAVTEQPPGVQVVDLTRLNNVPKLRFAAWAAWIRRDLKRFQPDVLHVHQVQAAGWLGWLAGYHPLVMTAWGSDLLLEPHKNALRRWLVRRALHACDRLVAPSPALEQAALELGLPPGKIARIPWGIDARVFAAQPDDREETRAALGLDRAEFVILCPRSPAPLYHLREVLLAFSRLASRQEGLRLVLLEYNPDPAYVQSLRALSAQLGLGEKLIWLPAQKDAAAMARLYRAADVMVSVPASEGYGLSVYEAMACGCPAVISDLPVFVGAIQDGRQALKVPAGDVDALESALDRLLGDPGLRQELAERGSRLAAGMSSSRIAEQAEALYAQVVASQ